MSGVITDDEALFVDALKTAPILGDGMDGSACHRAAALILRLAAEVDYLRASNEAVAAVAEAFLHKPGGPIPKFCIWPNVQIRGGCLKAGRKPFGCESYQDPQCNECRAHDSVAKAILSSFNPAGSVGET